MRSAARTFTRAPSLSSWYLRAATPACVLCPFRNSLSPPVTPTVSSSDGIRSGGKRRRGNLQLRLEAHTPCTSECCNIPHTPCTHPSGRYTTLGEPREEPANWSRAWFSIRGLFDERADPYSQYIDCAAQVLFELCRSWEVLKRKQSFRRHEALLERYYRERRPSQKIRFWRAPFRSDLQINPI